MSSTLSAISVLLLALALVAHVTRAQLVQLAAKGSPGSPAAMAEIVNTFSEPMNVWNGTAFTAPMAALYELTVSCYGASPTVKIVSSSEIGAYQPLPVSGSSIDVYTALVFQPYLYFHDVVTFFCSQGNALQAYIKLVPLNITA
eukprot:m.248897 g.248897  ORF g.248897 m.248897 type:complete len:144 (-) comp15885_c0_seq1:374-805(-)